MKIVRTQEEIDNVMNAVFEGMDEGSRFPGASFETGIDAFYRWLTDRDVEHPFEK